MNDADFSRVISPHRRDVLAHCHRLLGSRPDAEDALQETLVRAWRAIDRFEGRASVRTWLRRIATRVCFDERRVRVASEEGEPHLIDDASARYLVCEATAIAFMTAIDLLPPRQRVVLVLRDVLELSADETARASGLSIAAVTSALQRARETVAAYAIPRRVTLDRARRAALAGCLRAWKAGDPAALAAALQNS